VALLQQLLLVMRVTLVYVAVLSVVAFVNDLRRVIVNELREIFAAERASVGSVLDRRASCTDELL